MSVAPTEAMTLPVLPMSVVNLTGKRVIIREDFNVPIQAGVISNDQRIRVALPTIRAVLQQQAAVILLSHFGRPAEERYDPAYSLLPVAEALSEMLGQQVRLEKDWLEGISICPGEVVLAENVRFNRGETANDPALAKKIAALGDVFVMDAFATAHRTHASTVGVAEYVPCACAGPLLIKELTALSQILQHPKQPMVAIVGGSKVSTKIQLLTALLDQVDVLLVGGGIANTFLVAQGYPIGQSLHEPLWIGAAQEILIQAKQRGVQIPLPSDVAVADHFAAKATAKICSVKNIAADEMILDVGPETAKTYPDLMAKAGTIVWNGPVGVFEFPNFSHGTRALGEAVAASPAFSVVGGGDTVAAVITFGLLDRIDYLSTGGGAFLALLQGDILPAVAVLEKRAKNYD